MLHSQRLISYQQLQSFDPTDVSTYLTNEGVPAIFVPVTNGMDIYKITYNTVSYDSTATIASGTVFIPTGVSCKVPVLSYNHGTTLAKVDAPSNQTGEFVVGVALGADGYIISMPDYLGLGDSPGLHPYHHARSEATCSIDMLRATYEFMDSIGYSYYNDEVFITGYSQGGHVAMATLKFIQENLPGEFNVGGTAPLSGAYDMAGVQAEVITRDSSYGAPGYLPFILFSFNMVYNVYPSYSDIFVSPYDTLLPPLMDGSVGLGTIESLIPDTPNLILQPALLDSFETNPAFIFRQLLLENSLYDWIPQTPVKMFYCEADHLVSYRNAIVTLDSMLANGATDVEAASASLYMNHQDCALYALLQAKYYFEGLRKDRYSVTVSGTSASGGTATDGSLTAITDGGYSPFSYQWSNSATGVSVSNLAAGSYTVTVTDANGCTASATAIVSVTGTEEITFASGIRIYPNPAQDQVSILFGQPSAGIVDVRLSDLSGRTVSGWYVPAGTTLAELPLQVLAPGIYLLTIESNGIRVTEKLVIE